jgi:hypothetical protein
VESGAGSEGEPGAAASVTTATGTTAERRGAGRGTVCEIELPVKCGAAARSGVGNGVSMSLETLLLVEGDDSTTVPVEADRGAAGLEKVTPGSALGPGCCGESILLATTDAGDSGASIGGSGFACTLAMSASCEAMAGPTANGICTCRAGAGADGGATCGAELSCWAD